MKLRALAAFAAVLSVAAASEANAKMLHFAYSDSNDVSFSFDMDSNPTPDSFDYGLSPSPGFYVFPGSAQFNNPTSVGGVTFYTDALFVGGGLSTGDMTVNMVGDVVFSGDPSTPEFSTGIFEFSETPLLPSGIEGPFDGAGFTLPTDPISPVATGELVVTDAVAISGAPEPGTWALMLGGVGILGGMLRVAQARRRKDEATAAA